MVAVVGYEHIPPICITTQLNHLAHAYISVTMSPPHLCSFIERNANLWMLYTNLILLYCFHKILEMFPQPDI